MTSGTTKYEWTLIESDQELKQFSEEHLSTPWLAFDTEFIPERYFRTRLCLIAAATINGNYLIDVVKIPSIAPFLSLLENKDILKITHAGENDYRILELEYDVRPKNLFDTQLAYGFLDYEYPVGLQAMVARELGIKLRKSDTRSDWEKRPLTQKQLNYAASDVVYLNPLKEKLEQKLSADGKLSWALEETARLENPDYFRNDPFEQICQLPLQNLSSKEKIFLVRLHEWRLEEARRTNRPVNSILKNRVLKSIAKNMSAGKAALMGDRTMPHAVIRNHWDTMLQLYEQQIDAREQELLGSIPEDSRIPPEQQVMMDLLHQLIKLQAAKRSVSPSLVLPKKEISKMKNDPDHFPESLAQGWRHDLLGPGLMQWLRHRKVISAEIDGYSCVLTMEQ